MALLQNGMMLFFGALVKIADGGILIPGIENTGKTNTAWALAKRGALFVTDEYSILNSEGLCYGIPCSSFMTPATVKALGLKLTRKRKLVLALNSLKGKVLTVHLRSGRTAIYPDQFFKVCSKVKVNKVVIIQNGIDSVRSLGNDEALSKIKAIQTLALPWRTNPYILAHRYFDPQFNADSFFSKEEILIDSLISRIPDLYLVSSTSGDHYKAIEKLTTE